MDLTEIDRALKAGLQSLAAVSPMRLSEWAEQNFYLSAESSYVEQRWNAYPYQRAIMDAMSNDEHEEVTFMKSARVGYTKMILAAIGYFAEHKRRNQALWQPTDDDSDEFCKTELEPMFRDVPAMIKVFPSFLAKNKENTLRQKKFLSSVLHLRGGKAAKNYRRLSVDVSILDELDGFDTDVEKEGSPVTLARKRIEGATFPKLICGSTPKLKGFSLIEARFDQADAQFYWHFPCPHCGEYVQLRWGGKEKPYGFKWIGDDASTVLHACSACGAMMSQADYLAVWEQGRWIADDGTWIDQQSNYRDADGGRIAVPKRVAFHIWTAYSPQTTWAQIVAEFLSAKNKARAGDKGELKTFVNTTLGETWEEEVEKADMHALMERAEAYPLRVVQMGGLVLVAGVDLQDNRFEVVVWAIGRGEEMWVVDYMVIEANPADERDWEKLDTYLQTCFSHACGTSLRIEALAIDTGGHFTHQAYTYCRSVAKGRRVFAIKGDHRNGQPVKGKSSLQDVNYRGKVIKSGIKLWHVGTDTAKDLIFGRLKVTQYGPGFIHFSKDLSVEFYNQLTAEVRVLQRTAGGEQYRWVPVRKRNEVLDCTVYALFAAHMLDLHRYTDRMWERLEEAVQPKVQDMFALPFAAPDPVPSAPISIQATPVQTSAPVRRVRSRGIR
ncbi:Phage terminase, large subunit GpA [Duganella sp. CF458]|uniref:phage terminase large subunit family protein n=1 Tax=Duganella sp. CF458 TaxID=1884368 RepID=UPI0008F01ECE|nr:phage terminase large subunit family protein [Duganella sp. CF458]SFG29883.1 Phage terminase, large subunit GpA [Duganella sp. CF458]